MTMTDEPWAAQVAKRARAEKQLSGSSEARAGRRRAIESREVPREGGERRLRDRPQAVRRGGEALSTRRAPESCQVFRAPDLRPQAKSCNLTWLRKDLVVPTPGRHTCVLALAAAKH